MSGGVECSLRLLTPLRSPGRRQAAVCAVLHGRGAGRAPRGPVRHYPEALGRPRRAGLLQPLPGVPAQRLCCLVSAPRGAGCAGLPSEAGTVSRGLAGSGLGWEAWYVQARRRARQGLNRARPLRAAGGSSVLTHSHSKDLFAATCSVPGPGQGFRDTGVSGADKPPSSDSLGISVVAAAGTGQWGVPQGSLPWTWGEWAGPAGGAQPVPAPGW